MHLAHGTLLAALIGLGSVVFPTHAQTIGYNTRTGDVWIDSRLGEINDYGHRYRDPFIDEMSGHYGVPRSYVLDLLDTRHWAPGDVYYACALAQVLRLPCANVVREYDRNPGQGWGAVAKRMGIKPGSAQFHALKRGAVGTYDRWGYPIVIDRPVRVDWSEHGPGRGKGTAPRPGKAQHGSAPSRGNTHAEHGPENSGRAAHAGPGGGKSHRNGKTSGQGNGNGGNARGNGGKNNGKGNGGNGKGH